MSAKDGSSLALVIKVPSQASADLVIEGASDWTVRALKERISAILPNRPAADHQKLVYYGKLLEDQQTLQEALKQNTFGGSHTIHLVVNGGADNLASSAVREPTVSSSTTQPAGAASAASSLDSGAYAFGMTLHQNPAYSGFLPTATMGEWNPNTSNDMSAQQFLWMQLYYQQMQYMQALYQHHSLLSAHTNTNGEDAGFERAAGLVADVRSPLHGAALQPHANYPAAAAALPEAVPLAARDRDVVRMNAQGGADDADGGENQDVLDWLYMGMRGLLLFSILYFYSSLGRLVLVFSASALLWVIRGGFLQRRNAAAQHRPQPEDARAPAAAAANAEQQPQPRAHPAGLANENPENQPGHNVNPTAVAGRGVLAVAASVVGNFFATLIPHNPAAANLN